MASYTFPEQWSGLCCRLWRLCLSFCRPPSDSSGWENCSDARTVATHPGSAKKKKKKKSTRWLLLYVFEAFKHATVWILQLLICGGGCLWLSKVHDCWFARLSVSQCRYQTRPLHCLTGGNQLGFWSRLQIFHLIAALQLCNRLISQTSLQTGALWFGLHKRDCCV